MNHVNPVYLSAAHLEVDLDANAVTAASSDDGSVMLLDEPHTLDPRERAAYPIAEHGGWPPWRIGP